MYVSDQMSRDVFAVAKDTSIDTVSRLLVENGISGAPVISETGVPIGVVTLADLANASREGSDKRGSHTFYVLHDASVEELTYFEPASTGRVEDVMSDSVLSIDSSAALKDAGLMLVEHGVHRLLVIDEGKLVGIVSTLDVLRGVLR